MIKCNYLYHCRYLWIKHNNQNGIKEGPISNFMPKIDCQIDAAYWVPQRSTAYLFNGTDISDIMKSCTAFKMLNKSPFLFSIQYRDNFLDCERIPSKRQTKKHQQSGVPVMGTADRCCGAHSQNCTHPILHPTPVLEVTIKKQERCITNISLDEWHWICLCS